MNSNEESRPESWSANANNNSFFGRHTLTTDDHCGRSNSNCNDTDEDEDDDEGDISTIPIFATNVEKSSKTVTSAIKSASIDVPLVDLLLAPFPSFRRFHRYRH